MDLNSRKMKKSSPSPAAASEGDNLYIEGETEIHSLLNFFYIFELRAQEFSYK